MKRIHVLITMNIELGLCNGQFGFTVSSFAATVFPL